jgi:hypothetical protein
VITVSNELCNIKAGFSILSTAAGDPRRKPGPANVKFFQSVFQRETILLLRTHARVSE